MDSESDDFPEYVYPESEDEILQQAIAESLSEMDVSDVITSTVPSLLSPPLITPPPPPPPVLPSRRQARSSSRPSRSSRSSRPSEIIDLTNDLTEDITVPEKYSEERNLKAQQDLEYEESLKEDLEKRRKERIARFERMNEIPKEEPKIYTNTELDKLRQIQNNTFFDNLGKKTKEDEKNQKKMLKQQQKDQLKKEKEDEKRTKEKMKERKRLADERSKAFEKRFKS